MISNKEEKNFIKSQLRSNQSLEANSINKTYKHKKQIKVTAADTFYSYIVPKKRRQP